MNGKLDEYTPMQTYSLLSITSRPLHADLFEGSHFKRQVYYFVISRRMCVMRALPKILPMLFYHDHLICSILFSTKSRRTWTTLSMFL